MVTIVLLNVALIYAIARVTFRRTFFRFDFAKPCSPHDANLPDDYYLLCHMPASPQAPDTWRPTRSSAFAEVAA
jgi:hypothetical protein